MGRAAFYVMGKGRRFLGPDEVTAWGLNHEKAAATPAAQAVAVEIPEDAPAQDGAAPPAIAATAAAEPDLETIAAAIGEAAGHGDVTDARLVWRGVLKACGDGEPPPVDIVASMIRDMGIRWRRIGKNRQPLEPGLIEKKIGNFIAEWRRKVNAEAHKRERAASDARIERVNGIWKALIQLERDALDALEYEHYQETLDAAAPDERAEAERRYADWKTQQKRA